MQVAVEVLCLTRFTPATDLERDPVGVGELKAEGQLGQRQHQQQLHGFDSAGTDIKGQLHVPHTCMFIYLFIYLFIYGVKGRVDDGVNVRPHTYE